MDASVAVVQRFWARYVIETLKPKRVIALTDQRNPIALAVAAAFQREWPRDQTPVDEWPFRNDTEQIDFAARLAKGDPALVLFAGSFADLVKLQEQLQDLKASATFLYGGEDMGRRCKPGLDVLTATVFAPEGLTDEGKKFAKRFEDRFQEAPTFEAAQAYDAGRVLFDTMHELKKWQSEASPRKSSRAIRESESLTGKLTRKDRKAQRPVFVIHLKDREAKVVRTVMPDEK